MFNLSRVLGVCCLFLVIALPFGVLTDGFILLTPLEAAISFVLYGLVELAMAYFISVFFEDPKIGGDLSILVNALGSSLA